MAIQKISSVEENQKTLSSKQKSISFGTRIDPELQKIFKDVAKLGKITKDEFLGIRKIVNDGQDSLSLILLRGTGGPYYGSIDGPWTYSKIYEVGLKAEKSEKTHVLIKDEIMDDEAKSWLDIAGGLISRIAKLKPNDFTKIAQEQLGVSEVKNVLDTKEGIQKGFDDLFKG